MQKFNTKQDRWGSLPTLSSMAAAQPGSDVPSADSIKI